MKIVSNSIPLILTAIDTFDHQKFDADLMELFKAQSFFDKTPTIISMMMYKTLTGMNMLVVMDIPKVGRR